MQLKKITSITGTITLQTGLHIGAGDTEMHIGGTDNPVIIHPHTREPYIPGSSLKGKMRSLLELRSGLMGKTQGDPLDINILSGIDEGKKTQAENILRLFGVSGANSEKNTKLGPTRASFSDCPLNTKCRQLVQDKNWPLLEVKSENSINRISGTAQNPRFTERVPAGMIFDFNINLKEMENEPGDLVATLLEGMKLLEYDALGGSGSRGYGRITFTFDDNGLQKQFSDIQLFE